MVVGQFDIHPEDTQEAAELMRLMMNATIKEQGCHHYAYSRDLSTPNRFQLSELWEDNDALVAHFRADHMARDFLRNRPWPKLSSPLTPALPESLKNGFT